MKKALFLLLFGAILSINAAAQSQDDLFGTWRFTDLAPVTGASEETMNGIRLKLADTFITLSGDMKYDCLLFGVKEAGTWTYDSATRNIVLTSAEGEESKWHIDRAETGSMTITVDDFTIIVGRDGGKE